jgi:hypothetical protein
VSELRGYRRPSARIAIFCITLLLVPGCLDASSWVEKERPWSRSTVAEAEQVRVERLDGTELTLDHPVIGHDEGGDFLSGVPHGLGGNPVRVDLADIRALELREVSAGNVVVGIAAGLVIAAAIVLFLLNG